MVRRELLEVMCFLFEFGMEKDYIPGVAAREVRNQFVSIYRLNESIERESNAVGGGFSVASSRRA
jgi:hypothetical protein